MRLEDVQSTRSQYAKNTLVNLFCNAASVLLLLVSTPFLIKMLGETQYGLYRVALVSLVGYSMLLNMGFGVAVRRYFSDAWHRAEIDRANEVLSVAYTFHIAKAALVLLLFASALLWLPPLVETPSEYLVGFRLIIGASGLYVCSGFLLSPLRAVLMACSRYDLHRVSDESFRLVMLAGGMALVYLWKPDLQALAVSTLFGIVITISLTLFFSLRVYRQIHLRFGHWNSELFRELLHFGRYGMMMVAGAMVLQQSPDILIAGFLGPQEVAGYAVAALLISQSRAVTNAFATPLFPIASGLKANDDYPGLNALMLGGTRRCLWAWGAVAFPTVVFAESMLSAWVGAQFAVSFILVWILVLGSLGDTLHYSPNHILHAAGSIRWLGYSQVIFSVFSLVCMIGVLMFTSLGTIGVVWSLAIPTMIRGGILVPVYACRQMKSSILAYYTYSLIPCALYATVSIAGCCVVRELARPESLIPVLAVMCFCAAATAVAGLWLMLSKEERIRVYDLVSSTLNALLR